MLLITFCEGVEPIARCSYFYDAREHHTMSASDRRVYRLIAVPCSLASLIMFVNFAGLPVRAHNST